MGWVVRGKSRYYARGERRGGAVRQVYLGDGPLAELAAAADQRRRAERRARAEAWRIEEARRAAADAPLDELGELAELLTRAALVAAGYHRHDRGSWRRRRGTRGTQGGD